MRDYAPGNQNVLQSLAVPTFPLPRNSKRPAHEGFLDRASVTPDFDPRLNNTGVATGGKLFVLDFDVKPGRGIDARQILRTWDMMGLPHSLRVRTPSGGLHVYLLLPDGHPPVANSASKISPGVDVRGQGGYVVGPGSRTEAGEYMIEGEVPDRLAVAPEFILEKLAKARESAPDTGAPATDLDTDSALAAAADWLIGRAPAAIAFQSGNATTYGVAARVKDFGVSEPVCLDLLLGHWNERCEPPWDRDDLARITANAYRYGTSPPGEKSPLAEFSEPLSQAQLDHIESTRLRYLPPAHEPQPDTTPLPPLAPHLHPLRPFDIARDIRPRVPVLGTFLVRSFVSALISPPGVGKTTFGIAAVLSVATGKPLLGPRFKPGKPQPAFLWSQEDDPNELLLRLAATMRAHGIEYADTIDHATGQSRLHVLSGVERPIFVAVPGSDRRSLVTGKDAAEVLAYLRAHGIAAAFFDPLAELHGADENDNAQIARLFSQLDAFAANTGAALSLI